MSAKALVNLKFTPAEKDRLSDLAMNVEIHEKKRFAINKNITQISDLLNFAVVSTNPLVMRSLRQFAKCMTDDTAQFLRILSVDIDRIKSRSFSLLSESDRKTIRSQQMHKTGKSGFTRFFGLKTKDFV